MRDFLLPLLLIGCVPDDSESELFTDVDAVVSVAPDGFGSTEIQACLRQGFGFACSSVSGHALTASTRSLSEALHSAGGPYVAVLNGASPGTEFSISWRSPGEESPTQSMFSASLPGRPTIVSPSPLGSFSRAGDREIPIRWEPGIAGDRMEIRSSSSCGGQTWAGDHFEVTDSDGAAAVSISRLIPPPEEPDELCYASIKLTRHRVGSFEPGGPMVHGAIKAYSLPQRVEVQVVP